MPDPISQIPQGNIAAKDGKPVDYGRNLERLPKGLQEKLADLKKQFMVRDQQARRWEVRQAQKQRFFWNGQQHLMWNNDLGAYQVAQSGGITTGGTDLDDQGNYRAINIYLAYGKSFCSVFCQNQPASRFEPEDPKESIDISSAQEANKMRRVIEKFNNPRELQTEIARLLWTDGRVVAYTRYVTDGQRFGFEDQPYPQEEPEGIGSQEAGYQATDGQGVGDSRNAQQNRVAKGRELIDIGGVLEWKVPISLKRINEWPYAINSQEHDITTVKATYSWVADKISSGSGGVGPEHYARIARIAATQGSNKLSQGGTTLEYLVAVDKCWFRPSAFIALPKEDTARDELLKLFPDGCHCVFVGDVYCESRNESMDDHLSVVRPIAGDGQNTPSLGAPAVDPQEVFNEMFGMSEDAFRYCIPATWVRKGTVDIDALNEQQAGYGAHFPANDINPGTPLAENFYTEPPAQFPAEFFEFMQQIQGPLLQFLTGQMPSLFGESDSHNETKGGIEMLRDQALGLMGLIWMPFTVFWSQVMLQAVRCAANNRPLTKPDGSPNVLNTQVAGNKPGQQEPIEIRIEDLKGNILCFPETDENFPESWSSKSNKMMTLWQAAPTNPIVMKMLSEPDNMALVKDMIGLEDLVIPEADSRDKQLEEISEMLKVAPIPPAPQEVEAAMLQAGQAGQVAQAQGIPAPPPPNPQMLMQSMTKSSVPVDPITDNHAVEAEECKRWINSPEGQKAKRENQDGYANVRQHLLEHMQALQAMAPPPMPAPGPQGKPPAPPPPQNAGAGAQPVQ